MFRAHVPHLEPDHHRPSRGVGRVPGYFQQSLAEKEHDAGISRRSGKTYEMWMIRGGKPAPAGLFLSNSQGNAIHLYRPPTPPVESDVVAVTLEAAGGVAAPTSTPIIVAPL